ncbi:ABC transporter permease [Cupriavidus plantarum]|uniref:NitT/TauT family transport system permease protein n=1 Tax=Cupriavidus plantarum TaxID=942865 RepID=A0A316ERW3_9BURK|nr:ABC transporter permease [Cupriavidus plantarum]PWK34279.1 NitT/TauT family transport system permease protein [Cupriavidus plantarum]CAG2138872.1 Riboflavin transport system permease protein RibX [Cupriavidus plantarum]SMR85802.1 NitT/TauT family transport system permease protein [Cupriavidus plantarum]
MSRAMTSTVPAAAAPAPSKNTKTRSRFDSVWGRSLLQLLIAALVLRAWQFGVDAGWISAFMVGSPAEIWKSLVRGAADGQLWQDSYYTLFEAILGFAIGTIAGSALGLALWYSPFVARLTEPFIIAINSIPKIAFGPIVILWFGTGLISKVALAVSLTSIVALIAAYQAAKNADLDFQTLLVTLGADKRAIFFKVIVPSSLPAIISTFHINIGFGLVGAVVGEFISSEHGLGHMIFTASGLYDLNTVWAGLFMLMVIGFGLYFVVDYVERKLLPWKEDTHHATLNV